LFTVAPISQLLLRLRKKQKRPQLRQLPLKKAGRKRWAWASPSLHAASNP